MSENSVHLLFESKSTLNVLNNLLKAALDTVLMAKTTGKTYKSIFDNSISGVQILDKNNAIIHNHAFNLTELRHALYVVLTLTGTGLIGHYAYKNRQKIQESGKKAREQMNKKIEEYVGELTIYEVISQLGQRAVDILKQFPEKFNQLRRQTFENIKNFIKDNIGRPSEPIEPIKE